MSNSKDIRNDGAHRDPIFAAPASHPMGTGVGAALGGAAAGAAAGTVAGPMGMLVGAAVGAVVGGITGKGVAEAINPTQEHVCWRDSYGSRSYVEQGTSFSDCGPACALGVGALGRNPGRTFDAIEPEMSRQWTADRGASTLRWDSARPAVREAWNRLSLMGAARPLRRE